MMMMDKTNGIPALRSAPDGSEGGLFATWIALGTGFVENGVRVSHALVQNTRHELSRRTMHTLEWAESFPASGFRLAKLLVEAVDSISNDVVTRSESAWLVALRTVDRATDGVRDLTGKTVASVVGAPAARDAHVVSA